MSAARIGDDVERDRALLGNADHRDGRGDARQQSVADHAAFVLDPGQPRAARLQQFGQCLVAVGPADFLVMAEGEHDGAHRPEAACRQQFGRFHHRDQRALVVDGAAPPHITVGDDAREGRMLPLIFRTRRNRHHVDMRHHQHRVERGVASRPRIKERVPAGDLAGRRFGEGRVGPVHPVAKAGKGRVRAGDGGGVRAALMGNRLEAHGFGQTRRGAFGVDACRFPGRIDIEHRHRQRPADKHRDEQDDEPGKPGQNALQHDIPPSVAVPRPSCVRLLMAARPRACQIGRLRAARGMAREASTSYTAATFWAKSMLPRRRAGWRSESGVCRCQRSGTRKN